MGRFQQHGRRSARRSQLLDAPGIRGDQQQLGYLVGRALSRRGDAITVADSDSHADANVYTNAHTDSDSHKITDAHTHTHGNADAYSNSFTHPYAINHANAHTDPYAITYSYADSNRGTHRHADGDSDSATYPNPDAITVANSDSHANADDRCDDSSAGQSRRLLSRFAGAERRDAALSRLPQRGRTATRACAE